MLLDDKQHWVTTASSMQDYSPNVAIDGIIQAGPSLVGNQAFWRPLANGEDQWFQVEFPRIITIYAVIIFDR